MKLFLAIPTLLFAIAAHAQDVTLDQRLVGLVETLQKKQMEYHIPGMQLAVVLDDEVVLVHSFGESNIELALPVTNKTLFPIGSVTKSFTATAIATLVDEGTMRWDAPITEYLPEFILPYEIADGDPEDSTILVTDLLSHQTGFTRFQFLGINNTLSHAEMLAAAVSAEPVSTLRTEFLYTNLQYLAAGYAAGKVDGSDWNTVVEERLLAPIGMTDTFTSWRRAGDEYTVVTGHVWDEEKSEYKLYPLRTIDNIGPAGSIVSTAGDLARWVLFHLGRGEIDGKRALSETQHAELWKPQMKMSPSANYGLGWMLYEQNDTSVVEHGGSVRGGCAKVAMFPDENLGFVLLMNVSESPLVQESVSIVYDALLGEISGADVDSSEFAPYVGTYIGNFASFDNAKFTVQNKDGVLALDVPDQMLYELKLPDEDGKWYFALTDQIAVSFDRDDDDNVVGLKMYQAGMTFELPREGVELAIEIPLEELDRYLGSYYNEEKDVAPTVVIQNNRLGVDVPDQMVFDFHPPSEDGVWVCRLTDKLRIRFIENETKVITGFEFFEGDESLVFSRVSDSGDDSSVDADSILAQYNLEDRGKALASLGSISFKGSSKMLQSGIGGETTMLIDPDKRYFATTNCGKFGWFRFGVVGDVGLMDVAFIEPEELNATQIKHMYNGSPLAWVGDWAENFSSIEFVKEVIEDDRKVWIFKMQEGEDPARTVAVDQTTGDVVFVKSKQPIPELGIALPYKLFYRDFKEVDGVRVPMTVEAQNDMTGKAITTILEIETGIDATDDMFKIEPREQPEPWVAGSIN
jgi:CubicO group peptidase (beta-lactamase class C family)